ncbi:MAG: tyrosine-type recombinase/integrase [Solirubrobacteraceae bacterium]
MAIVRRGDRYGVRIWDPAAQRHRWLGTFERLQDAKRAEANAISQPAMAGTLTVAEWARDWQEHYARGAASTQRTYRYACKQIVDSIGGEKLADITRPEAKKLANQWSRSTTRVARTMWADAYGLCHHNPFTNLRLETPKGRKDITALTEAEIEHLAQVAREHHGDYGDEIAALIVFAAYTGVRPGELAALRWSDLDIPNRRATISRALDGQGGIKSPKNGKPRRIVLPPQALRALGTLPRPLDDAELIFHTPRGKQLTKASLAYQWRRIAAAWRAGGGRDLDLHELRHACATLLLERGLAPADVAVQLGHTDGGRLVMTLYGHPDEDRARDRLDLAFAADGHKQSAADDRLGLNSPSPLKYHGPRDSVCRDE